MTRRTLDQIFPYNMKGEWYIVPRNVDVPEHLDILVSYRGDDGDLMQRLHSGTPTWRIYAAHGTRPVEVTVYTRFPVRPASLPVPQKLGALVRGEGTAEGTAAADLYVRDGGTSFPWRGLETGHLYYDREMHVDEVLFPGVDA